ncbi:hypothetical protein MTP99_014215 [Tenebrio molitor]|nr:hypothetical protein MTP99_014215 [Tenebrio molitor]
MVRQLPYDKPVKPCIKRAQQRSLDACVLDKNHLFGVKAFALTFEGFVHSTSNILNYIFCNVAPISCNAA